MLLAADGVQRAAWAVRGKKAKTFSTSMICEDERSALELKALAEFTDPSKPALEVVPVLITVQEVPR